VRILGNQLLDGPCRVRAKDTKVCSGRRPMTGRGTQGLFSYPDIVIVCDEPEYFDASRDILVNPAALVEVLSKTTESFDRGAKFTRYQRFNPSLREYLLVSQTHPEVEHYSKQQDGSWLYHLYTGLEAVVPIASIGCSLKLSEIYHRVRFPEPEIEEEPPRFETMS
jgi:Uma2 family endonuclease